MPYWIKNSQISLRTADATYFTEWDLIKDYSMISVAGIVWITFIILWIRIKRRRGHKIEDPNYVRVPSRSKESLGAFSH